MVDRLAAWVELVGDALREIRVHKLRSLLTLSGMVFGAASLVSMISLAGAMKEMAYDDLSRMGLPRSFSLYDQQPGAHLRQATALRFEGLRLADLEALRGLPGIQDVKGRNFRTDMLATGPAGQRTIGVDPVDAGYTEQRDYGLVAGRTLRPLDIANHSPVVVVGNELVRDLFGDRNPIGQYLKLDGIRFLVVGVIEPIHFTFIPANFNEVARRVYIPYTWVSRYRRPPGRLDMAIVTAPSQSDVGRLIADGTGLVRRLHNGANDFRIQNDAAEVQSDLAMVDDILGGWNTVMFAIGGITLLVGGIGLFSVLLISVRERVREIGIRKALGADDGDITRLFLAESLTLAALGAGMGVGGGTGLVVITELIGARFGRSFDIAINQPAVVAAVVFSLLAGLVFGWYPARKAAQLDPIEAMSGV